MVSARYKRIAVVTPPPRPVSTPHEVLLRLRRHVFLWSVGQWLFSLSLSGSPNSNQPRMDSAACSTVLESWIQATAAPLAPHAVSPCMPVSGLPASLMCGAYPNMRCCGLEYLLKRLATIALLRFGAGSVSSSSLSEPSSESAITLTKNVDAKNQHD